MRSNWPLAVTTALVFAAALAAVLVAAC